jgi:hypothetical protein
VHCTATFHGAVGGPQSVDVAGLPPGAEASVVFNGVTYGTATADSNGRATIQFQLPSGVAGAYQIVTKGVNFSAACDPFVDASGHVSVASTGGGVLAHTGLGVGLLVAAALALVAAGILLRRQRRRLHAQR